MLLSDEESSAPTTKSKPKKKVVVSIKEFLTLNDQVDQILSDVTNLQREQEPLEIPPDEKSIVKRLTNIEEHEKILDQHILLHIKFGMQAINEHMKK